MSIACLGLLLAGCSDDDPEPPASDGCNGHVELCDRGYDEVAYAATHNSMSAADEPGWLFTEQPDGIIPQLDYGVRVLLIDTWYGQTTDRRGIVATADKSREEAFAQAKADFGSRPVNAALRARRAAGLAPSGDVRPYLCHAMCELGSTSWLSSLRAMKNWLDDHPREVVTLFVQDEVSPADTAGVFESAGVMPYVYTPDGDGWPTLRGDDRRRDPAGRADGEPRRRGAVPVADPGLRRRPGHAVPLREPGRLQLRPEPRSRRRVPVPRQPLDQRLAPGPAELRRS